MSLLVGFQVLFFSLFAKAFAIREGLLPREEGMDRFLRRANLEVGVLIGLILLLFGMGLLVFAFVIWGRHHFGHLSYPESLRLVIPSVTFIMLGIQTVFSSFFLSILGLRVK
jgi:hypothetical protein